MKTIFIIPFLLISLISPARLAILDDNDDNGSYRLNSLSIKPVPLPAVLPFLASALGFFGFFGWRRKKAVAA